MLISFAVSNFRCIDAPVKLEMEALKPYKELESTLLDPELPGTGHARYLKLAAVYGANATGKSTLLRALRTMQSMVLDSARLGAFGDALPYEPFAIGAKNDGEPTSMQAEFVIDAVRYEYSFSYSATTIVAERLCAYPKGFRRVWFERTGQSIKWSSAVRLGRDATGFVRPDALILSVLGNYPDLPGAEGARKAFEWFERQLDYVDQGPIGPRFFPYTGEILDAPGSDPRKVWIRKLVREADLGITGVHVERRRITPDEIRGIREQFGEDLEVPADLEAKEMLFDHRVGDEVVQFDLGKESDGTKQLVVLAGPVADALQRGGTLIVDELDASLHPALVREVVRLFQDSRVNAAGAQLVFSAHDPTLLDGNLLRRDAIWFTQKDLAGAMALVPLSDYRPRKGEAISAGYLGGRYDTAPAIPALFEALPLAANA